MSKLTYIGACAAAAALAASPVAHAKDACTTVVCLYGEFTGQGGGSQCDSALEDYFSIIDYHNGHIDYSATPKDRLSFLSGCKTAGSYPSMLNNSFGGTIK